MITQVLNDFLLLIQFCVEELEVALKFRLETLVRVAHKVGFVLHTLLECFHNVSLDVIGVELSLRFLVLIIVLTNVLVHAFLLTFNTRLDTVVNLLLLGVFSFDLSELRSQGAQFLNLRSKSVLLVLALSINLLHKSGQFLQTLALHVIQLLFHLGDALDLVLHIGVALNTFLLLETFKEVFNVAGTLLEDLLGAVEDLDLSLDFVKSFLHLLVVIVFDTEGGGILLEVIALQILATTNLLVGFLLLTKGLL